MKKLKSLTIFFHFYNDEGTVEGLIHLAYTIGRRVTGDLEVIAIHGGPSSDKTKQKIFGMQAVYPDLKIIDKSKNTQGYAVIKYGFMAATKNWVFYTDGDEQYHLETDLERLIEKQQKTQADVVNGYKKSRSDSFWRVMLGKMYAHFSRILLQLPIRDVDCDFRLMRGSLLKNIIFESTDSSILPELVKKLQLAGAKFAEIPVAHYPRVWGSSNYTIIDLVKEKLFGDVRLYFKIRKIHK